MLTNHKLFLFDMDGTICRSFLREGAPRDCYDQVELLPNARTYVGLLRAAGHHVALVTNQAGVAMGYQQPDQVCLKIATVLRELGIDCGAIRTGPGESRDAAGLPILTPRAGLPDAYASFEHPEARLDRWRIAGEWRKPGPGMLLEAIRDNPKVGLRHVKFVGDRPEDGQAAANAGVAFEWAHEFFDRDPEA